MILTISGRVLAINFQFLIGGLIVKISSNLELLSSKTTSKSFISYVQPLYVPSSNFIQNVHKMHLLIMSYFFIDAIRMTFMHNKAIVPHLITLGRLTIN